MNNKFESIFVNKRQVARWKQEAADKVIKYNIYMHSQGNLIGGSDTNRNHNYYSYGAPISRSNINERFGEDTHIEMNKKDPVSGIFGWNYAPKWPLNGHDTENYGARK